MFRLSTKSDYGLILLSALAHPWGEAKAVSREHPRGVARDGYVSLSTIAKKNKISSKFLSQVAQELKKAGIVSSREGVRGGYLLAKKPGEIKILDVLKVLDGELVKGECFEEDHECTCGGKAMWVEMKEQLEATIGKKTVADLVTHDSNS